MQKAIMGFYLILLTLSLHSQDNKLVLRNGLGHGKLLRGMRVYVAEKGETDNTLLQSDKKVRDSLFDKAYWTVDSISQTDLYVVRSPQIASLWKLDTVLIKDTRKMEKIKRMTFARVWKELYDNTPLHLKYAVIYKMPTEYRERKIPLTSIASLNFAQKQKYDGGFNVLGIILGPGLMIGGPFAATNDDGSFNPAVFAVCEAVGGLITYTMIQFVRNMHPRVYDMQAWNMKVKKAKTLPK